MVKFYIHNILVYTCFVFLIVGVCFLTNAIQQISVSKEIVRDFLIITSLGSTYIYWVSSETLILITVAYSWRICMTLSILQLSQTRFPRINKEFPLLFVWVYRDRFAFDRCLSSDWWNSWIFLACHISIAGSFLFFSYNLL